jgi:anti-sigma factor RsiW
MTCADVAEVLDAFVDAELPPPMLVAVARHAATCGGCEQLVRELTAAHDALERTVNAEAEALDLGAVWPAVARAADRIDARRRWLRRARTAPVWGVGLAAAIALFFLQSPVREPVHMAARPKPNQAVFERIDSGGNRFELRRDRKYGTTLIMVSADQAPQ